MKSLFLVILLFLVVLLIEHSKQGSRSGNCDRIGGIAELFLHFGGGGKVGNEKAGAGGSGGDDCGKGKECLFHD